MLRWITTPLLVLFFTSIFGINWNLSFATAIFETLLPMGSEVVYENCGDAFFVFERANSQDRQDPLVINFSIAPASSATSGDDFSALPNSVTIPVGSASISLPVNIINDNDDEGNENIIITPSGNCQCTLPFDELIIVEIDPLTVEFEAQQICAGDFIELVPIIDGGLPDYEFSWSNGSSMSTISVSPNATTSFDLMVTDECGGEAMASVMVEVIELPTARIIGANDICTGNTSVNSQIELTGQGPWMVEYDLDGVAQTAVAVATSPFSWPLSQAGTYTLTSVSGLGDCVGTAQGNVVINFVDLAASYMDTPVSCFGVADGDIDLDVTGGSAPYQYQWTGGLPAQADHNDIAAGDYVVLITDANGCTLSSNVRLRSPAQLEASIRLRGADCDLSNSTFDATVSGGTAPFTYQWSHVPDDIKTPGGVAVGNFDVQVTDANGCIATGSITVDPPSNIQIQIADLQAANCTNPTGGGIRLQVTNGYSPYTYNWSDALPNRANPTGLAPGNYTVEVVDAIGCIANSAATVPGNFTPPIADAGNQVTLLCPNTGVALNGNNSSNGIGFSYQWTADDGQPIDDATTLSPNVFDPGIFTLEVTDDANGCTTNATVDVVLDVTTPLVAIEPMDTLDCFQPELSIDASASNTQNNFTIQWSTFDGEISSGENSLSPNIIDGGTYTIIITNPNTGCFDTDSIRVEADLTPPIADGGNTIELNCNITEVDLGGRNSSEGAQFTYNWTTADGTIQGPSTQDSIIATTSGTYIFSVTNNENGCVAEDEILVIDNSPSDILISAAPPVCPGERGSLEISGVVGGSGSYFYSLNGGTFSAEVFYGNLEAGIVEIVALDENECSVSETVELLEKDELIVDIPTTVNIGFGEPLDVVTITNLSDDDIADINWTPADDLSCDDCLNPTITPQRSNTYTLTVRDNDGCEASNTMTLIVEKNYDVYFPNIFSPYNQDGINDIFYINSRGSIVANINQFRIVDRWGNLVFQNQNFSPNDPTQGWDGFVKNKKLNSGVFLYHAEIEFIDGEILIFSGDVAIID